MVIVDEIWWEPEDAEWVYLTDMYSFLHPEARWIYRYGNRYVVRDLWSLETK